MVLELITRKSVMENLESIKAQLQENLREIIGRGEGVRDQIRQKDPGGNWSYDDLGIEGEFDDVLNRLGDQNRKEALETWQALNRIDRGTYGICTECGGKIEPERLEAMPATEYCLSCAKRLETKRS
ncbi:MAG TPA: TraR/DksA C4-type zinc finger protein [Opitutales bacterium]|nr:TraR/DksA C4-type zinc finger protein [Opitutales bacterium]